MGKKVGKVKDLKLEQLKSDQLKIVGTVSKILREIDYVKTDCVRSDDDNLLNQGNAFEGVLGANVYFVGRDMVIEGDNGLLKRTEVELRKHSDETGHEDQSLCHIYQTTCWDRSLCRRPNALKDLLITLVTPNCLKQEKHSQKMAIKTKNGLLNVHCTAQESPINFVNYLYYTVSSSIRHVASERENYGADSNKILDFVTKGK